MSTKFCLAHPGHTYLIYLPDGGDITVNLTDSSASFQVEWFSPLAGKTRKGTAVQGGAQRNFQAPGKGDWVLYLAKK